MNKRTLTALKKSIIHWIKNTEGPIEKVTLGVGNCALCDLFYTYIGGACKGCPVSTFTGAGLCLRTPYNSARFAFENWMHEPTPANKAAFRRASAKERDFLICLLPEGESVEYGGWIYYWRWE